MSLPAVLVDLRAFDANAESLARSVSSRRPEMKIRIATKSFRVPALIRRALDASPVYQGLMCYAAEEIPFLASQGFDDFLLAYPTLQPVALRALADCAREKKISVVADSPEGIDALAQAARESGSKIGCVLELDVSRRLSFAHPLGARRSPLQSSAHVKALVNKIILSPELKFEGIMAYESQVAGVQDLSPFKNCFVNLVTRWVRGLEARAVARRRQKVLEELEQDGVRCRIVNGGGSGSLSFALSEERLTEVAAGSALLAPHLFSAYSNLKVDPALFVALEVVRSSEEGWVTCAGGGYVASGAHGMDRLLQAVYPEGSLLSPLEGCGEVQTPVNIASTILPALGTPLFFRPAKAGEPAERFKTYQLWDGKELQEVPTYRGMGVCFL